MKRTTMVIVVLCALARAGAAQQCPPTPNEGAASIIYGAGWTFTITAPAGWVFDCEGGRRQGLSTAPLPRGLTWDNSAVLMYALARDRTPDQTIAQFVTNDVARWRGQSPSIVVEVGNPVATAKGRAAPVRRMLDDRASRDMTVAYLAEDSVFVILALTAKARPAYGQAIPAFEQLVRSYEFLPNLRVR